MLCTICGTGTLVPSLTTFLQHHWEGCSCWCSSNFSNGQFPSFHLLHFENEHTLSSLSPGKHFNYRRYHARRCFPGPYWLCSLSLQLPLLASLATNTSTSLFCAETYHLAHFLFPSSVTISELHATNDGSCLRSGAVSIIVLCMSPPSAKTNFKATTEWSFHRITIWLGTNPIIVLNDAESSRDLLDKRADIFPSRPRPDSIFDLENAWATTTRATLADSDHAHIRLCHDDEAKKLTMNLLIDAGSYAKSLEQYVRSTISRTFWGRRSCPDNEHGHFAGAEMTAHFCSSIHQRTMVEPLPWLAYTRARGDGSPSGASQGSLDFRRCLHDISRVVRACSSSSNLSKMMLGKQERLDPTTGEIVSSTHG